MSRRFYTSLLSITALTSVVLAAPSPTRAQSLSLFSTGVDADGAGLPGGSADSHYAVIAGPGILVPQPARVLTSQLPGTYVQSPTSRWIWVNPNGLPGDVTFTFRTTFDLTGYDPSTAVLAGRYATDNYGSILLNGNLVFSVPDPVSNQFGAFTNFSLGSGFVPGVNTLDFVTRDAGQIGGLNVDRLHLTASAIPVTASTIPEPGTLALAATGLLPLVGVMARRRRA